MARLPRLTAPGFPHHIIQRGNNRQAIFMDAADFEFMLGLLAEQSKKSQVAVHAYVLMGNHFHLLATPETTQGLPLMMQAVGRSYVRYFNHRHGRTGTLWEGRYRSTIVQSERYLLACMAWSSHAHCLGLRTDRLITPHALFWALGNTPFAREAAYAALVQAGLGARELEALTQSALTGWALGEADFIAALQARTERRVTKGRAGRPSAVQE